MKKADEALLLQSTGASAIRGREVIQELWSGYGRIERVYLEGAKVPSVVVKDVQPPGQRRHPRGWSSDLSHQRKLKSYAVEIAWYTQWSSRCGEGCRVPRCLAAHDDADEFFMILEDLDAVGYPLRKNSVSLEDVHVCLEWLATFHATFMNEKPTGLWTQGSYWHLETRPDELEVLADARLKAGASAIDQKLRNARFQTLVHGDAKLANFCFAEDGAVAAVDFQYIGGGCGMVDVAYFLGSCLDEEACEKWEVPLLDHYFEALRSACGEVDVDALEEEWRELYAFAWADFHRFLKGWSPGHWKITGYSERICAQVLDRLGVS
ncbi:phosphotransferase [Kiritimatiellaeota bacterium B1221]|nr:phosphotransferase [Kiritimatiellaeota bacterium B1221]